MASNSGIFSKGGFTLAWVYDQAKTNVNFTMSAQTTGWISMGYSLNPSGGAHSKTEMMVAWVSNGQATLFDTYSDSFSRPTLNGQTTVKLIAGGETNGVTTIKFQKQVKNTLPNNLGIPDASVLFQYAYGSVDGSSINSFPKHTRTGTAQLNFLQASTDVAPTAGNAPSTGAPTTSAPAQAGAGKFSNGPYSLSWAADTTKGLVTFTMTLQGTGWVGMGYSKDPSDHSNAEMIVGWVTGGQATIVDGMSNSRSLPTALAQSSVKLVSGTEANGVTTIVFTKPINPTAGALAIFNDNVNFQYAYHTTRDGSGSTYPKHENAGSTQVNFLGAGGVGAKVANTGTGFLGLPQNIASKLDTTSSGLLLYIVVFVLVVYSIGHYVKRLGNYLYARRNKGNLLTVDSSPLKEKTKGKLDVLSRFLDRRVPRTDLPVKDVVVYNLYIAVAALCVFVLTPIKATLADALGYITAVNGIIVVLTGLRNSLLMWFLEVPFDRAIALHRLFGYFTFAVVIGHGGLYIAQWYKTLTTEFQDEGNFYGLLSWIAIILLLIFSLPYFRRKHFNIFYYLHIIFFCAFFYFGYKHSTYFGQFAIGFVFLYGVDRLIRFMGGFFPHKTLLVENIQGGAVRVRFPKPKFLKSYKTGQYVFVCFPGIKFLEWHPFTLSSCPSDPYGEIVIRGLGDYTKKIVEFSKENPGKGLYIRVDGPYGQWPFNFKRYRTVVLVAGGVGITPCISMLREVFHENSKTNSNGNIQRVHLIWTCPDYTTYDWFSEEFEKMEEQMFNGEQPVEFIKSVFLTKETGSIDEDGVYVGRPDIDEEFQKIHRKARMENVERIAVISCGPAALVNGAWDQSTMLSTGSVHYDFHHETFEF